MSEVHNVKEILKQYKANMDRQRELDELLLTDQDKQEWIACLQNRATENQRMYSENGELINALEEWLLQSLDEETAELLYDECYDMYWNGYDDCQVLLPIVYKLIEYYEKSENIEKLMFLYGAAFFEKNEVQNRREGIDKHDTTYNLKVLQYKKDYLSLNYVSRRRLWASCYNLIVSGYANKAITAEESFRYYQDAMEFWNSTAVQQLDGENEEIVEIVNRIKTECLIIEEKIEECSKDIQEAFCRVAFEIYEDESKDKESIYEVNSEVYAAYLHAKRLKEEISLDEMVDNYFAFYQEKMKLCPEVSAMTEEDMYFVMNTPLIIERWLHKGVSLEKTKHIMGILKRQTQDTWYTKLTKFSQPFINGVMTEWCFRLIQYMESQDEKEECLFQLLVRRQLPTYLHSVMVANLAESLCKEAKRNCPEVFEGLDASVTDDLVGFVKRCALLHDVGKTKITDIVNTQGRRLWDSEFSGIKNHPAFGAEMIEKDSELVQFRDIVLGHHKFFDGSAGYPVDFDNTKSPYRNIIDLITICDCIDAATDHLGRNYKRAKSLAEVLCELVEGKGTRYNPKLVEIIENSPRLKKEMSYIVSEGRLDIMYRAYLESVF